MGLFNGLRIKKHKVEYYNLIDFEEDYPELFSYAIGSSNDLSYHGVTLAIISLEELCLLIDSIKEDMRTGDMERNPLFIEQYKKFQKDIEGVENREDVFINIEGYCL